MGREASPNFTAQEFGGLVLALRSDLYTPKSEFLERVEKLSSEIRQSVPADGFSQVRLPGDRPEGLNEIEVSAEINP